MHRFLARALAVFCLAASACSGPPSDLGHEDKTPDALFVEVAAAAGIDFVHGNGATGDFNYPELMHSGCAFLDFDNDGWLDVYLVQAGPFPTQPESGLNANRLYRNQGDGTFTDITDAAGVGDEGYGTGVAVADYDRDGDVDLFVTNLGANSLYRNELDGSLTDVTEEAGVGDAGYASSAAFLDYDVDGDLDLYVVNYLDWSTRIERPCYSLSGLRGYCSPGVYNRPQADILYRNEGDGTFTDVSREAGIRTVEAAGLGVVTADFDGNGWIDIYVTNDQMLNTLWLNNGNGTFRDEALLRGSAVNESGKTEAGMGVVTEDLDDDGDWDLFMVHLSGETNTFYRNVNGNFQDVTEELALGAVSQPYTGFGTALFDFDNDGYRDLFIANGKVRLGDSMQYDYAEPNQLFRGTPGGGFEDVTSEAGAAFALREVSRGAAFGDYDNDGDPDILLSNNKGPVRLLRNEAFPSTHHRLSVQLVGRGRDRDAIGALVHVVGGQIARTRIVQPAYSYSSSNDPRVRFGLGNHETNAALTVSWPNGETQRLVDVAPDRFLIVPQPAQDGLGRR